MVDVTATAAELNILDGVTADASELNLLDGVTATTAELNYVDGVTSNIQTQLDGKGTLANQTALITLSGVSAGSTTLGSFTGATISDNKDVKGALQELEIQLDNIGGGGAQAGSVSVGATDTDASFFLTFVSDNNATPTQESFKTDAGISYNPSSNILSVTSVSASSDITVAGDVNANGNIVGDNSTNIT